MLNFLLLILTIVISVFLIQPFVLYLFSLLKKKPALKNPEFENDLAVIITAYKDGRFILPALNSVLKQAYSNFIVYVIADNVPQAELIDAYRVGNEKVYILRPGAPLNSKVRSIEFAYNNFIRDHEYVCILDADNIADNGFLKEVNRYLCNGYKAVQGMRVYKNINNSVASLDALRDLYYNFYDQQVPFNAGISSGISGSAMVFESNRLLRSVSAFNGFGGFDKVLQYDTVLSGSKIAFSSGAIVYDEKTDKYSELQKQRTRWIHTWFRYYILGIKLAYNGIINKNPGKLFFGLQLIKPPVFLTVISAFIILAIDIAAGTGIRIIIPSILLFTLSFFIPVIRQKKVIVFLKAVFSLPLFIFSQVKSMLNYKKASKGFLGTSHDKILTIEEILTNNNINAR